ncbi:hypothetical protein HY995_05060 [Candidatus Micrarchaeota archaeon]|nr:hypothetical protein [Candidatus Micrarchaeota archaeon]MBI5177425.1 hypothetical protein [Candidatus Micrarchaeota archaeon]
MRREGMEMGVARATRRPGGMRRGDAAMWTLTKIAMIFFIGALAAIVMVAGGYERTGLCNEQARLISSRVSGALSQLFASPLEDERRLISLEPSLAVGEGKYSRYAVKLARHIATAPSYNSLIVTTVSDLDPNCAGSASVTYPKVFDQDPTKGSLLLIPVSAPAGVRSGNGPAPLKDWIVARPSVLNPDVYGPRSTFISIVKCTEKNTKKTEHYLIQDCSNDKGKDCLNLDTSLPAECKFN